jgi:sec-independent protein translocase protein TatB
MFDIGFSEMVIIAVLALIVVGPERLPRVARTIGHLVGRLQRYVSDVKADINREMELEELRKMRDSVQQAATSIETAVQGEISNAEGELAKTESELSATTAATAPDAAAPPVKPQVTEKAS